LASSQKKAGYEGNSRTICKVIQKIIVIQMRFKSEIYDTFNPIPFGSHMQILKRVKEGSVVLDVGCATGELGKKLIEEKNCKLYGIEIDRKAAKKAKLKGYKKVICGDVETIKLNFKRKFFDVIIFADVLEHLKDPFSVLLKMKKFLKKKRLYNLFDTKYSKFYCAF